MQVAKFSAYLAKLESLSSRLDMMAVLVEVFGKLEIEEVRPACYILQGQLAPSYQNSEFQLSTKMILRALAQLSQVGKNGSDQDAPATDLFGEVNEDDVALIEVTKLYKKLGDIGQVAEQIRGSVGKLSTGNEEKEIEVAKIDQQVGGKQKQIENEKQSKLLNVNDSQIDTNQYDLTDLSTRKTILSDEKSLINSVASLHQQLLLIAQESGSGSQERKVGRLVELLLANDPVSARYICRVIMGKLRLGFSTMTILDALSWLVAGDKSLTSQFEEAYQKRADLGELAELIVASHRAGRSIESVLAQFSVKVGVPVVPALCQRLNSAGEIIEKLQTVIAEPKYDGLRVQIHVWRGGSSDNQVAHLQNTTDDLDGMLKQVQHDEVLDSSEILKQVQDDERGVPDDKLKLVRVFTRNLEDATHMFPELADIVQPLDCKSCVLDAEAIGFDHETGKLKTFQETITRKRKHDIAQAIENVPLKFFVFDILEKDGQPLIDLSLTDRKKILTKILPDDSLPLVATEFITTSDAEELQDYHHHQLSLGLEGMVAKAADSQYRPGRKGWRWVKIKEAEGTRGKLNDTLDLVVMGYYLGRGKRAQFGLGALLVGVLDDSSGEPKVLSISKIGTGLSEDQLTEIKNLLEPNVVANRPTEYQAVDKTLEPDVWVLPNLVLEIAADEITDSPVHGAGVALRFPRLIKIRHDKTWQQGTSMRELATIV